MTWTEATWLEATLVAQPALVVVGIVVALTSSQRLRGPVIGLISAVLALVGATSGAMALAGWHGGVEVATALPLLDLTLVPTPLGGFFQLVAGAVGLVTSVFAIGYAHGPSASRTAWAAWPAFLGAMQLVPAAGDVVSFLLLWELMALTSTILVLTEQSLRAEVRSAALWYAVLTHLSFVLILVGFAVLAADAGGVGFADLATVDAGGVSASVGFVLLIGGFATKAGIVPLHVWLPRAHPAAPSHVSAAMSGAMVKMGVYGALLVSIRLLPDGPSWWGLVLLALGGVSAVYGILQASVASDLKRLLAYSTTENVGLMFLALGTALLLRQGAAESGAGSVDTTAAADTALVACFMLVAGHAVFKATLFLAAGSILHATGERDLDRMGGLGSRMPVTSLAFGIGALGAAALPLAAGFPAEWTLLQSLIHGARPDDRLVAVAMPAAVAVVALTAGLALMTFVKAYGIAFLARPRSEGAAAAYEGAHHRTHQGTRWGAASMWLGMLLAAAAVAVLGFTPGLTAATAAEAAGLSEVRADLSLTLALEGGGVLLDPVALTLLAAVLGLPVVVVSAVAARRRPRRRVELAWGCGGVRVSPRMQYTATSYAEPLARVFDDALQPERDIEVTHTSESRYLVERIQYRQRLDDVIETRVYRPAIRWADRFGVAARRLQNGSIHRYLGYSFIALVAVLVVVAL